MHGDTTNVGSLSKQHPETLPEGDLVASQIKSTLTVPSDSDFAGKCSQLQHLVCFVLSIRKMFLCIFFQLSLFYWRNRAVNRHCYTPLPISSRKVASSPASSICRQKIFNYKTGRRVNDEKRHKESVSGLIARIPSTFYHWDGTTNSRFNTWEHSIFSLDKFPFSTHENLATAVITAHVCDFRISVPLE